MLYDYFAPGVRQSGKQALAEKDPLAGIHSPSRSPRDEGTDRYNLINAERLENMLHKKHLER